MKHKMITIIVSLVAIVAVMATVGVTFALWEAAPSEYSYTVGTESYVNIDIQDLVVGSGKLKPKSDSSTATTVDSAVNINIQDYKCKLTFTASKLQYLDKQASEWLDVPSGIIKIVFTNEAGSLISDKTHAFEIGMHKFLVRVSMEQDMDIIDPVYKDTQFRFNVHIGATAEV